MKPIFSDLSEAERENLKIIVNFLLICQIVAAIGSIASFGFGLKLIPYLSFLNFLLWSACRYLYKKNIFGWAQVLFVLTTNFSVANYTFCLGFELGWFFYFFTSTLSMFVFLRTENKRLVDIAVFSYVVNFVVLFVIMVLLELPPANRFDKSLSNWIFLINFPIAYYMCYLLVRYFIKLDGIRKLHSSQLLNKKERIESENKQLELFNYIVSHNLKGPLSRINGLVHLLEVQGNGSQDKEVISYIKESVCNVDQIITDLNLILSNKRKSEESKEQFDFQLLLDQVINDLDIEIQESHAIINKTIETKEIYSIKSLWYSILYNLMSNSIKYKKEEVVPIIDIRLYTKNNQLVLECSDNGIGMDLDKHGNKIFQLYTRLTLDKPGKGIGLFLIKNHVALLDGEIELESQLGIGTKFKLKVPV